MKFFLLLLALLFGVWLWRSGRSSGKPENKASASPTSPPQDMVRCASCGVHVPRADAVAGQRGFYCCTDHCQRAEL